MKNYIRTIALVSSVVLFVAVTGYAQEIQKPCTGTNGLMENEITEILDLHNKERTDLALPLMKWDCTLADLAHEWVTRGIVEHRDTHLGENIFVASDPKMNASESFKRWLGEKPFWNAQNSTCQQGKNCTHYSQMISKTADRIGCSINRSNPGKWPLFLVCNYDSSKD